MIEITECIKRMLQLAFLAGRGYTILDGVRPLPRVEDWQAAKHYAETVVRQ